MSVIDLVPGALRTEGADDGDWGIAALTSSAGTAVPTEPPTDWQRFVHVSLTRRPGSGVASPHLREVLTVGPSEDDPVPREQADRSVTAAVLTRALSDMKSAFGLRQDRLADIFELSPSTVMHWKRQPNTRPRHDAVPRLVHLWAALNQALEELGLAETRQVAWRSGLNDPRPDVDAVAEALLDAVDVAGIAALESTMAARDDEGSRPPSSEELVERNAAQSTALRGYLEGLGGTEYE